MENNLVAVYSILCVHTGKRYVGSSVNTRKRLSRHRQDLNDGKHHSPHLQRAWVKRGADNFKFEVLESVSAKELLLEHEQKWIDFYRAADRKTGFNIMKTAGNALGFRHSAVSRRKMSVSHRGVPMSPERRAIMGSKGEKHPSAILTDRIVLSIKTRLCLGEKQAMLASEFGVTKTTLNDIAAGRSWAHVGCDLQIPRGLTLGSQRQGSKLTEGAVATVKDMLQSGLGPTDVSRLFGVGFSTIADIQKGKTWRQI